MKKKMLIILSVLLSAVMAFSLAGCGGGTADDNPPVDDTPKEYVIQYTDDSGTHQINVTDGMPYSLDSIPTKNGYTFMGLYDSKVGGTQYVSEDGSSLSPFTDKKNMVLFPQFKAKEYTVILDYQGAPVTGNRQITVTYDSNLPELPKNLTIERKEFSGWYTKANCEGQQVADRYGLIPVVSVINDTNFDLETQYIYLYAGFEVQKYTVTFCFEGGMDTEEVKVPYNTPINEVVPNTRVNGNAVLTWSKTQGGEVFNGKVTDDIVLYAKEYAPVIELDTNGGDETVPVVARAGSTISLPTPTKANYEFIGWLDENGKEYSETVMPQESLKLTAMWQAIMILFDENGGTDVADIFQPQGTKVTLPETQKEGFIFAGWFDKNEKEYKAQTMPTSSVRLYAKYWKITKKTINLISGDKWSGGDDINTGPSMDINCNIVNVSDIYNQGIRHIKVDVHYKSCYMYNGSNQVYDRSCHMTWYSQNIVSEAYKICQFDDQHRSVGQQYDWQTHHK